jgi:hypothetical protein
VLNLTISGNTVSLTNLNSLEGIAVESGSSAGTTTAAVCLNMLNNNSSSTTASQEGYRLSVRPSTTFQLQNFAGSGTSIANVQTWITTTKTNTGTSQVSLNSGGAFSTVGSCPVP